MGGDQLKGEIIQDRRETLKSANLTESQIADALSQIDDFGREVILELGASYDGVMRGTLEDSGRIKDAMSRDAPNFSSVRFQTKLEASLTLLKGNGLVSGSSPYRLTVFGYAVFDILKKSKANPVAD